METKYLIEHKELHTWLRFDGTLTNNPNDESLLCFNDEFSAKEHLEPLQPTITSDFSGLNATYSYHGIILWQHIRERTMEKNNGADLYKNFYITEHEYLSS